MRIVLGLLGAGALLGVLVGLDRRDEVGRVAASPDSAMVPLRGGMSSVGASSDAMTSVPGPSRGRSAPTITPVTPTTPAHTTPAHTTPAPAASAAATGPVATGRRQVVVDTDTGLDDALALLYLAGSPHADIAAVTTVYGNCVVEDSARNAAHVMRLAGLGDVPISLGAAGPLEGEAHIAGYVHGLDGLGDLGIERPDPELTPESSAERLVSLAAEHPGRYDLLALGPLTNLALALQLDPLLVTKYRSTVIMGGSGPYQEVGRSLMVDANVQNDAEAARIVLGAERRSPADLVMVGVDVTCRTVLDEAAVESLRGSETAWGEFSAALLGAYMDFYQHEWGRRLSPVHDGLAAAVLVRPDVVTSRVSGPGAVLGNGYQVRARVFRTAQGLPPAFPNPHDPPLPDVTAVTSVDVEGFLTEFVTLLAEGVRR